MKIATHYGPISLCLDFTKTLPYYHFVHSLPFHFSSTVNSFKTEIVSLTFTALPKPEHTQASTHVHTTHRCIIEKEVKDWLYFGGKKTSRLKARPVSEPHWPRANKLDHPNGTHAHTQSYTFSAIMT